MLPNVPDATASRAARANAKAEVAKVFALELSQLAEPQRQQLLDGLLAISIWSFWEALRTELGLGPAHAEELLRVTFTALLTAAGPRPSV